MDDSVTKKYLKKFFFTFYNMPQPFFCGIQRPSFHMLPRGSQSEGHTPLGKHKVSYLYCSEANVRQKNWQFYRNHGNLDQVL